MAESTKAIASLKHAANYVKLAMHEEGPRSFKRGQGALLKVIEKFGKNGSITKDEAKRALGWRGCDVRDVAAIAAENGYIEIDDGEADATYTLSDKGTQIIQKRLAAEDKAADAVMAGLTAKEIAQLEAICEKISKNCEDMGIDYSRIQKKAGKKHCKCHKRHGKGPEGCHGHHGHGHGHHHHHEPKCVIVIK